MHEDRKAIWVDQFQTRLLYRVALYLACYLLCWINVLFIWRLITEGPGNPLEQLGGALLDSATALLGLICLLPVLIYDALRFSHRLVGPLYRFRLTMQAIAAGHPVRPIKIRPGDYLGELRDDFNAMLESLQKQGLPVVKPLGDTATDPGRKIG